MIKKRILAFLLCLHTVLYLLVDTTSIVMAEEGDVQVVTEEGADWEVSQGDALSGEDSALLGEDAALPGEDGVNPEDALLSEDVLAEGASGEGMQTFGLNRDLMLMAADAEWISYDDYIANQALMAWENPSVYVGITAEFNLTYWNNFECASSPEAIVPLTDDVFLEAAEADPEGEEGSEEDGTDSEGTGRSFVDDVDLIGEDGESIKVILTDYYFDTTEGAESLWYKVEAAEGYTLPQVLVENPYVLHLLLPDEQPSFLMLPRKGMFVGDTVYLQNAMGMGTDSLYKQMAVADLPAFFDIDWADNDIMDDIEWFDLGDVSSWHPDLPAEYHYVEASNVVVIPAEVTHSYDRLMNAEGSEEFDYILSQLPESVTSQFTEKHLTGIKDREDYLYEIEHVEYQASTTINGAEIPVTVMGKIPQDGVTLNVSPVSAETVLQEGFDVKDATDIIAALDINITYNADGSEWQPEEGDTITVSIGMTGLGYEDGDIVRLHHKHGESIRVFEIFLVIDGKLTMITDGFSIHVISGLDNTVDKSITSVKVEPFTPTPGDDAATEANPTDIRLSVGDTVVYYGDKRNGENVNTNANRTWWVTDPEGAIYYELYTNASVGNTGVNANWLRVTALRETVKPITLRYRYVSDGQVRDQWYHLTIVAPEPQSTDLDGYRLYVRDNVNTSGVITATLIDGSGNEVVFPEGEKITYSWVRDDNAYIYPNAYKEEGRSIDICLDHGGLLQTRLKNVTYTVTATLPNGMKKTASYTVYYQSEILNSSFETPAASSANYYFLVNGTPGLYWKTTSPGEGTSNLTKDIEIANYIGSTGDFGGGFFPNSPKHEDQFAELNAENFGALYQDIITAPGEILSWEFEHAKRNEATTHTTGGGFGGFPGMGGGNSETHTDEEAMFLIMGPTEYAQEITDYGKITDLVHKILTANGGRDIALDKMAGNKSISYTETITVNGQPDGDPVMVDGKPLTVTYQVWYHNADRQTGVTADNAWTKLEGKYLVPDKQYRTRLFFVTDPDIVYQQNYGNLIDSAMGGQYKKYLIEYYEEEYSVDKETGDTVYKRTLISTRKDNGEKTDESDIAIMYASVELENFAYFEENQKNLLSMVFVNGQNLPYNLKYSEKPCLFIENYPELDDEPVICLDETKRTERPQSFYDEYDVVMQVCFRDTMIAVQKWVEFPQIQDGDKVDDNGNPVMIEALSPMQKQELIDKLVYPNGKDNGATGPGYEAEFDLQCVTEAVHFANETITITKNDPAGWYTGYVPIGDNPDGLHTFSLTEVYASPLTGLLIDTVQFDYYQFLNGQRKDPITIVYEDVKLEEVPDGEGTAYELRGILKGDSTKTYVPVLQNGIILNDKGDNIQKLAEIKVTNTYKEKTAKFTYKAVGHGTIRIQDETPQDRTEDSEEFAFYSGEPDGALPIPSAGYSFAGWYLDEACTQPVGEFHGYVGPSNNFVPNKNRTIKDTTLEVTYYAKFSSGEIQIVRESGEPGEVFVYEVKDSEGKVMYVTVTIGKNGTGSTVIHKASFGTNEAVGQKYTVTQLNGWSWRYSSEIPSIEKIHKRVSGLHGSETMVTSFYFPSELPKKDEQMNDHWLTGTSPVEKNVYGGGGS